MQQPLDPDQPQAPAPGWFRDALDARPEVGSTVVDGARIAYRSWGDPGAQDVVLVHGGAAHGRWWDHVAPLLATGRRVVALDLSGHGDSDRRPAYDLDRWSDEVAAVTAAAGIAAPPVVIGHSLGGLVTIRLARRGILPMLGAMIVDSPVGRADEHLTAPEETIFGSTRVYATAADAIARFRPVPRQPMLDYVAAHIASTSVREVDGGWTWKFDMGIFGGLVDLPTTLDGMPCRVVLFAGEHGIVSPRMRRTQTDGAARVATIEVPEAGHAIMLDEPLALVAGIRGVLAGWSQTA